MDIIGIVLLKWLNNDQTKERIRFAVSPIHLSSRVNCWIPSILKQST